MKNKHLIGVIILANVLITSCKEPLKGDSYTLDVKTYADTRIVGGNITPSLSDVFVYTSNTYIEMDTIRYYIGPEDTQDTYRHYAPEECLVATSTGDTIHHLSLKKGRYILVVRHNRSITMPLYVYYFRMLNIRKDIAIYDTITY